MKKVLKNHRVWVLFAVIVGVVFMQACAGMPLKSSEDALRQRVDLMMNAKMTNDWDAIYDFMDSSYRGRVTKQDFLKMSREIQFSNYRLDSLAIDPSGDSAAVKVKYDMSVKTFDFKDQAEPQQWIRESGDWYLKVKE